MPDLLHRSSPAVRAERTAAALTEAAADPDSWTLLDHPMLRLTVAGTPAYLEPDAVVAHGGRCTVVEIKSFPILDGSADPAKVGAAARQAAVYVLALQETAAAAAGQQADPSPYAVAELPGSPALTVLLVCPKDFSNRPTVAAVDVRRELATTRRQLALMTRVDQLLGALPAGTTFDLAPDEAGSPTRPTGELAEAVESVPAAYRPDCLSTCELGFHCRAQARGADSVGQLGQSVRGELGSITTVTEALAAAEGNRSATTRGAGNCAKSEGDNLSPTGFAPLESAPDEAAARLTYAAALRDEALGRAAR